MAVAMSTPLGSTAGNSTNVRARDRAESTRTSTITGKSAFSATIRIEYSAASRRVGVTCHPVMVGLVREPALLHVHASARAAILWQRLTGFRVDKVERERQLVDRKELFQCVPEFDLYVGTTADVRPELDPVPGEIVVQ